jgi:hypothetical protein
MTWAQRLKRVFLIDVTVCEHCGGAVKAAQNVIAANQLEQAQDAFSSAQSARAQAADQLVIARNNLQYNTHQGNSPAVWVVSASITYGCTYERFLLVSFFATL